MSQRLGSAGSQTGDRVRRAPADSNQHSQGDNCGESKRHIPIPSLLLERLKTLDQSGQWIFHARGGVALNPGNVLKRYVRPAAKELNIDLGGWHDFRHTAATSMLRAGYDVKVVSELLGHSDVAITLGTYDHVESEASRHL